MFHQLLAEMLALFYFFAREIPAKGKLTVLGKHFVLTYVIAFLWSFCFPFYIRKVETTGWKLMIFFYQNTAGVFFYFIYHTFS